MQKCLSLLHEGVFGVSNSCQQRIMRTCPARFKKIPALAVYDLVLSRGGCNVE